MDIPVKVITNPNILGELCRELTFLTMNQGELGCYSTFVMRPGFSKIEDRDDLIHLSQILSVHNIEEVSAFYHASLKMVVAWAWDGDGTLFFEIEEDDSLIGVINIDCKKNHGWEFCETE